MINARQTLDLSSLSGSGASAVEWLISDAQVPYDEAVAKMETLFDHAPVGLDATARRRRALRVAREASRTVRAMTRAEDLRRYEARSAELAPADLLAWLHHDQAS